MALKDLFRRGKKVVDDRGGTDALKADAQELQKIAKGPGSLSDKAKAAADALKDPGSDGPETAKAAAAPDPVSAPGPAAEPRPPEDAAK